VPKIVFHIGLHKTATTSLQVDTFPGIPEVNYLPNGSPVVQSYLNQVLACDPIYYPSSTGKRELQSLLDQNKFNLVSSEALSGPAWVGVAQRGIDHRSPVLENLSYDFPQAEIILILRRQDAFARSIYRQYVKAGGTASMARFLGVSKSHPEHSPMFARDRFFYEPYVRSLNKKFPAGVHVLFFEQLITDPDAFLSTLAEIFQTDGDLVFPGKRNSSRLGSRGLWLSRQLNRFFRNALSPNALFPGLPIRRNGRWTSISPVAVLQDNWPSKAPAQSAAEEAICDGVLENCRSDNFRLAELLGVDLSAHGYY